jgi:polyhydroxybutyrate depolymerase
MRRLGFDALADRDGFVVVYPEGLGGGWNDGRPSEFVRSRSDDADDVVFFRAMIDGLVREGVADATRIYVTGASNGGLMAYRLACDLSDRISAIAAVIANVSTSLASSCSPRRAIPVLVMNGTADRLMPWDGGRVGERLGSRDRGSVLSTRATVDLWKRLNGCGGTAEQRKLPDKDPRDRTTVTVEAWNECRNHASVVLYTVVGGGHRWPGDDQTAAIGRLPAGLLGPDSREIDASAVIWTFFGQR